MSKREVQTVGDPGPEAIVDHSQEVEVEGVTYEVRLATAQERFFVEWARDSYRQSAPFLQDTLQKLAALDAVLLGGSLVGLRADVMHPAFCLLTILLLLCSLAAAIWGAQPLHGATLLDCDTAIRRREEQVIEKKSLWLRIAAILLLLAFAFAVIGAAGTLLGDRAGAMPSTEQLPRGRATP